MGSGKLLEVAGLSRADGGNVGIWSDDSVLQIAEPSVAQMTEILKGLRDPYEAHHRVSISDAALVAAATLADRCISDRFLPTKAIDLIDEAGSRMRTRRMIVPPDLRELDEKIAAVRRDKESAMDSNVTKQ